MSANVSGDEGSIGSGVVPGFDAKVIADLGANANRLVTVNVRTDGLAPGLPEQVPMLFDVKAGNILPTHTELERYRLHPSAKKGTAKPTTLESFIALTNRHKTRDSAVFANMDWRKPAFETVVDYHPLTNDAAEWLRHRILYEIAVSEEWSAWVQINGTSLSVGEFASFIEDHISELAAPTDAEKNWIKSDFQTDVATPAELMVLSRGLQVNVEAKVKNVTTLQSGAMQVQFEEEHKDATGKPVSVPGMFLLSISPFFKGEKIRLPCRLRYRVTAGAVKWIVQMYRPDTFVTERLVDDLAAVASQTGLPIYHGTAEA